MAEEDAEANKITVTVDVSVSIVGPDPAKEIPELPDASDRDAGEAERREVAEAKPANEAENGARTAVEEAESGEAASVEKPGSSTGDTTGGNSAAEESNAVNEAASAIALVTDMLALTTGLTVGVAQAMVLAEQESSEGGTTSEPPQDNAAKFDKEAAREEQALATGGARNSGSTVEQAKQPAQENQAGAAKNPPLGIRLIEAVQPAVPNEEMAAFLREWGENMMQLEDATQWRQKADELLADFAAKGAPIDPTLAGQFREWVATKQTVVTGIRQAVHEMQTEPGVIRVRAGLDVGDALRRGLYELEQKYHKLPMEKKLEISHGLSTLPTGLYAWDILSFVNDYPVEFQITKKGPAADVVTVDGVAYWAPAVNYILWGRINRLLYDDGIRTPLTTSNAWAVAKVGAPVLQAHKLNWTLTMVADYRRFKSNLDAGGINDQLVWATVGWTGDWSAVTDAEIKREGFQYMPNPEKYKARLYWRILPQGMGRTGVIDFTQSGQAE